MTLTELQTRYLLRRDLPTLARLERDGCAEPWDAAQIIETALLPNHGARVVEWRGEVVGYSIWHAGRRHIEIVRLAVAPEARRKQCGAKLMCRLFRDAGHTGRGLRAFVPEDNTGAQLFLRWCEMRARAVCPDHYPDGATAYEFHRPAGEIVAVLASL